MPPMSLEVLAAHRPPGPVSGIDAVGLGFDGDMESTHRPTSGSAGKTNRPSAGVIRHRVALGSRSERSGRYARRLARIDRCQPGTPVALAAPAPAAPLSTRSPWGEVSIADLARPGGPARRRPRRRRSRAETRPGVNRRSPSTRRDPRAQARQLGPQLGHRRLPVGRAGPEAIGRDSRGRAGRPWRRAGPRAPRAPPGRSGARRRARAVVAAEDLDQERGQAIAGRRPAVVAEEDRSARAVGRRGVPVGHPVAGADRARHLHRVSTSHGISHIRSRAVSSYQ
jgi:hypothetical protein